MADDFPFKVCIPAAVLQEINSAVVEGFHAVPRGGVEVGGVLFGVRLDDSIHVRTHRPIKCQYSSGPSFLLSGEDQAGLSAVLKLPGSDSELADLEVLGWYHSHTRSEIFLTTEDLGLHREFFPEPWQIALVLRPAKFQTTRAGLFFRDRNGNIKSDSPAREFVLNPPDYGFDLPEPNSQTTAVPPSVVSRTADPGTQGGSTPVLRSEPEAGTTCAKDTISRKTTWWQPWMRWLRQAEDSERRSAPRESGDGLIAFYWEGGVSKPHRVRNISRQGAFIEADFSWPRGTQVALTLKISPVLPLHDASSDALVMQATVVRTCPDGTGFQFVPLQSGEVRAFRDFLSRWNSNSARQLFDVRF